MNASIKDSVNDAFLEYIFPGVSNGMINLRAQIGEINFQHRMYRNVPVILLLGETGVGKTFVAHAIAAHAAWLRLSDDEKQSFYRDTNNGAFLVSPEKLLRVLTGSKFDQIYLPLLTDEIAASELFGHVKGAFTGAVTENPGRLGNDELTDILLDEVGDATPRVQGKLLQVVESRMYTPVGGTVKHTRETQARLIFASHADLRSRVRAGTFREDLFWRLNGLVLHIPPLRECRDAIPDLVHALLLACKKEQGKENHETLPEKNDLDWCQRHSWSGNVRELRLLVWRLVYEEGRRSLKEIWTTNKGQLQEEFSSKGANETPENLVARAVEIVLDETLSGRRVSLGTVGKFTRLLNGMVRKSLHRLKGERRFKAPELRRLFSEEKVKDIHTKIGRFRGELEISRKASS